MSEDTLLTRITVEPKVFGGKPIIRGPRWAVEPARAMLAAGDRPEILLQGYPWLEMDNLRACWAYARRLVGRARVESLLLETSA